jgi:hypothetical protein
MLGTTMIEERGTLGGPAQRLARKIARKEKMIEEYERIARESDVGDSRGKATQEYFLKRAADFRLEKERMAAELEAMRSRRRRATAR